MLGYAVLWCLLARGFGQGNQDVSVKDYRLSILFNDQDFSYQGSVSISFGTYLAPKEIVINSKNLQITSSEIIVDNNFAFIHEIRQKNEDELVLRGGIPFYENYQYRLNLDFKGVVQNGTSGFYKGTYYDSNDILRMYAVTQFASIDARSAFPCFDEPNHRASFQLNFTVPASWSVISNTPIRSEAIANGFKYVEFWETPKMPTYLLAWMIFDNVTFTPIQKRSENGVDYAVYAESMLKDDGNFAISVIPEIIAKYDNYTGIPYRSGNMLKLDSIAVPDFAAGAMENWGIVTYKDFRLLHDPAMDTTEDLQYILRVIAHEFAHQWFGNLITASSWSHIWLNEGFARYFEFLISKMIKPEWRLEEQFVTDVLQVAMEMDVPDGFAVENYEIPLSGYQLETREDIDNMFNPVTYHKGASILRMTSWILGEMEFQQRIKDYLKMCTNHSGHATPENFLSSFMTNEEDFDEGLKRWTNLTGFPVVHVRRIENTLDFHQTIYGKNLEEFTTWNIPIEVITENHRLSIVSTKWIDDELSSTLTLDEIGKWYLINQDQKSYYQVNYDEKNWMAIKSDILKDPIFNPTTRAQLINDALSLMTSQDLDGKIALDFINFLTNETDFIPWRTATRKLAAITTAFSKSDNYENWKEYVRNLTHNIIQNTDFDNMENDNHTTKLHKINILKHACFHDHPKCNATINKHFINITATPSTSPDVVATLMCSVVKYGTNITWELLHRKYMASKKPGEKIKLLYSLGCSQDKKMVQRLLNESLNEEIVRPSNVKNLMLFITESPKGAEAVYEFLKDHETNILKYTNGSTALIKKIYKKLLFMATDMQEIDIMKNDLTAKFKEDTDFYTKAAADAQLFMIRKRSIRTQVCKTLSCPYNENGSSKLSLNILTLAFFVFIVLNY